jgi:hypothetical protein
MAAEIRVYPVNRGDHSAPEWCTGSQSDQGPNFGPKILILYAALKQGDAAPRSAMFIGSRSRLTHSPIL